MTNDVKMLNKQKVIARLAHLGDYMFNAVQHQLATEVDDLVAAQRRAAPINKDKSDTPGTFRDSIHGYPNPDRPLSYRIIADAKDEKGNFIGPHIEFGHLTIDGKQVAARPSFFPTYRARKKGMQRRINAAARKAAKALFEE
ncbi:MAG TPA: hypothetical protein VLZ84_11715 [Asticcacaulis sp.]|nr:hypothetical protein [Asticcacaulis sp.]